MRMVRSTALNGRNKTMQIITIEGRAGNDAKVHTNADGMSVLSINVAVQDPSNKEQTNWYRCSIWGKRALSLQQYLTKGTKIFAVGTMSIGEYEGKPQFNVRVNDISFTTSQRTDGNNQRQQRTLTDHDRAKQNGYQPDLEDEVPF